MAFDQHQIALPYPRRDLDLVPVAQPELYGALLGVMIGGDHHETLADLPHSLIEPLFASGQLLASAVEQALGAEGTFVAINNRVSQTVPHLHVHIVPRRKGDGLRGFFWPRQKYKDAEEIEKFRKSIRETVDRLRAGA